MEGSCISDSADFSPGKALDATFYDEDAVVAARRLIGVWLQVGPTAGIIVETEAYRHDDRASHSYSGETPRNAAMFGPPGHAYVYRSYGLHWCLNVVCRRGSAVLLRALLPMKGLQIMHERRNVGDVRRLCSGPGRLAAALGIDGSFDRAALGAPPFLLADGLREVDIVSGPRVGITRDVDRNWRFGLRGTAYLSRAFR